MPPGLNDKLGRPSDGPTAARDFVAASRLFAALEPSDLEGMLRVMRGTIVKRGSDVFVRGDFVTDVFAIGNGHVMLLQPSGERSVAVGFQGPGEICDLEDAVNGGRYKVGARAMNDVDIWKIPRALLLEALTVSAAAQQALINELAVIAIARRGFAACLGGSSVAERTQDLLSLIWMTHDHETIRFSQTNLAMLLGVSRQHVSQALRQMRNEGRLEVAYRSIALIDN